MSEEIPLGLYRKIHNVMKDVEYLSKDDHIQFNRTNYKAISEEKVTSVVRNALVKHGLVILPVKQTHKKDGNLTAVDVDYKIIDIETGQYEIITSSGTGVDTQDKGVGKAMTYSYKYLLLRTFAIPTGEDPDKISSDELDQTIGEKRRSEEERANQMILQLTQRGYDAQYIQQVCHQTIKPFQQFSELSDQELSNLNRLLESQLNTAVS